jgi:hypothetical protein
VIPKLLPCNCGCITLESLDDLNLFPVGNSLKIFGFAVRHPKKGKTNEVKHFFISNVASYYDADTVKLYRKGELEALLSEANAKSTEN